MKSEANGGIIVSYRLLWKLYFGSVQLGGIEAIKVVQSHNVTICIRPKNKSMGSISL